MFGRIIWILVFVVVILLAILFWKTPLDDPDDLSRSRTTLKACADDPQSPLCD